MTRLHRLFALCVALAACDLDLPDDDDDGAAEDESGEEGDDDDGDDGSNGDDADAAADEGDESSEGDVDDTGVAGDPIPAVLLGAWVIPGSTASAAIAFADDGSFARANVGELTGSCTTTIERMSAGTFVVEGDVVALHATDALKRTDMCGTVTEEIDLPPDEELVWQVGQDEWGEALTLTDSTGYAAVYHRE